jgi:nucleotide-binding universal stress UspA family protein
MQSAPTSAPVLVAFCPVAGRREALEFALAVNRTGDRPIVAVAVVDDAAAVGHLGLERVRRTLDRVEVRVIEDERPARGLARALDELAPSLVVLGARPGPARLGPTARRVLHVSACAVAIVPYGYTRPQAGLGAVGAAVAAGPEARRAIRAAAALVRAGGGRLRVISAPEAGATAAAGTAAVHDAAALLAPGLAVDVEVLHGPPVESLVAASERVDVLVMGSRASGPPGAVRLGTVSRAVLDRAACPVLLVPRGAVVAPPRGRVEAASSRSDDAAGRGPGDRGTHLV